jgi:hypothetical protein
MTSAVVEERDWTNIKTGLANRGRERGKRGRGAGIWSNPMANRAKPVKLGQGFASGGRVSRRRGSPHSDRIDENIKVVLWL